MTDPSTDSLQRLGGTDSYERTNELTKRVITLRGHLSEADARVATTPQRIQRKRTKGWRMPEGAVYVGRPTRWGNPFTVMNGHRQGWLVWDDRDRLGLAPGYTTSDGFVAAFGSREEAAADAVKRYRRWIKGAAVRCADLVPELAGRDLGCWCPLSAPCHADVLLELANR